MHSVISNHMKKISFISKIFSFITIFSLVVTFGGFNPKTAKAVTNPPMPESCGLDLVLVVDTSLSITAQNLADMKDAFNSFVDTVLSDARAATKTKIAVVNFDDTAKVDLQFSSDPTAIKNAINAIQRNPQGYTNWESAILTAQGLFTNDGKPHLIVFTSDGNPTASSKGKSTNQASTHLAQAVTVAQAAWTAGTRIITLGIGTGINTSNLIAISSVDASFTTNFAAMSVSLQDIATKLCGGKIIITKIIDADGDLTTTNDQTPGQGWNFDVAGVTTATDAQGKTQPISIVGKNGPFDVLQISQPGYVPLYVSCVNVTNNNQPVGIATVLDIVNGINMTTDDIISCTFYSKPGPPPTGTLSATNCTIPIGSNTCNTSLTWTTQNPIHISVVTTPTNITVASANSGTNVPYPLTFGSRNFFLYNNSDPYLAMATANATCDTTKTNWDGTKCVGILSGKLEVEQGGGLGSSSCVIKAGESTCKITLIINIENPVSGADTNITKAGNIEVASGLSPLKKEGIVVNYSSTTFYLNHNSKTLNSLTVGAVCESGSSWDGNKCKLPIVDGVWKETCGECNQTSCRQQCSRTCIPPSGGGADCPGKGSLPASFTRSCTLGICGGNGELNIKFSSAPAKIFKGRDTTLTWTSSGDSCIGSTNNTEVFDTGNKANGSAKVTPVSTTIYKITCTDKERGITETKESTVKVDTLTIHEE